MLCLIVRIDLNCSLKDEASKLLKKHKIREAEKREQESQRAKRGASGSRSDDGERVAKRQKSTSPKDVGEKSNSEAQAHPSIPSPAEVPGSVPLNQPFNPYHEGVSDDDEPQGKRISVVPNTSNLSVYTAGEPVQKLDALELLVLIKAKLVWGLP